MSPRPIDLTRARAGLARLDALLEAHPELQEPEAQARLTEWLAEEQRIMAQPQRRKRGDPQTRARVQRLREKRRQEGWQQHELWLDPGAVGLLERLKQPGESLSDLISRALLALEAQDEQEAVPEPQERPEQGRAH